MRGDQRGSASFEPPSLGRLGDDPCIEVHEQWTKGERKRRPSGHHGLRSRGRIGRVLHGPGDPVFPNEVGNPNGLLGGPTPGVHPARDASGIDWRKGVAFHMFRRTAATLLHLHGNTARQLSDWLGPDDAAFTMRTYVGQVDEGLSATPRSRTS